MLIVAVTLSFQNRQLYPTHLSPRSHFQTPSLHALPGSITWKCTYCLIPYPKILDSASSTFNPLLPNKTYSPLLILLCACLQKPKIDWDKLAFLSGLRDPAEANQTKCLFSSHEYIVSIHNQMPTSLMRPQ